MKSIFRSLTTASTTAVLCVSLALVPTVGCGGTQTPAKTVAEINVILDQATNILSVAEPGAVWVPQLQSAVAALKTSEASWQTGGGTTQDIINALNTVEAVTAAISPTAQYAPLVDVFVAGIQEVLIAFGPETPAPSAGALSARVVVTSNPHIGKTTIHHRAFRSPAGDFKAAWNEAATKAAMPSATLK